MTVGLLLKVSAFMLHLGGFRAFAFFLFIPLVVFAETTDLHKAAQAGDEATVYRFLKAMPKRESTSSAESGEGETRFIEERDNFGKTALYLAARYGHVGVVRMLLEASAEVDAADNLGRTPLHLAAERGHREVVHVLLAAGANVRAVDHFDMTALSYASEAGHEAIVRLLLDANARILEKGVDASLSALHFAHRTGRSGIIELLSDLSLFEGGYHALIETPDPWGRALFLRAIEWDDRSAVRDFIDTEKSDLTRMYRATLHAVLWNRSEILKMLLAAGVNVDAVDVAGETLLMKAVRSVDALRVLIAAGANVNAKGKRGQTALLYAAEYGNVEIVRALIDAGADLTVSVRFREGALTALHVAVRMGHVECVRALLNAGANPGPLEPGGLSPLAEVQEMIDALGELATLDPDDSDRLRPSRVSEDERRALEWPVRGRLEQYLVIRALLTGAAPVEVPVVVLPAEPVLGPNELSSSSAAGPSRRSW